MALVVPAIASALLRSTPYYEHQNNTGSSPNTQYNQFGLMLNLYFADVRI